ncbi:MAG TPA: exodeoxyribonuclease VII large subunit, partial [Atribacterota bacterium]|nr:exodeoxyribonuclease VII large subunit [Atribacterota bacterium]
MQVNPSPSNEKIFTVTSVTQYIQKLFSSDPILHKVTITGEISNFIFHSSGHMYFVLKDEQA